LDLDVEDEEGMDIEGIRDDPALFDAGSEQRPRDSSSPMPKAVQGLRDRDGEDMWAELG
jgi:hypothetical protein